MSLKTLISVSGRLTGDPSSCQKNFILFSKELRKTLFFFRLQFQLHPNTINRNGESHVTGAEIPARSSTSERKQLIIRLNANILNKLKEEKANTVYSERRSLTQ